MQTAGGPMNTLIQNMTKKVNQSTEWQQDKSIHDDGDMWNENPRKTARLSKVNFDKLPLNACWLSTVKTKSEKSLWSQYEVITWLKIE